MHPSQFVRECDKNKFVNLSNFSMSIIDNCNNLKNLKVPAPLDE